MQLTQQKKQVVVFILPEMSSNLDNIFYALLPQLIEDKTSLSHN